jgi:hypothetical protein
LEGWQEILVEATVQNLRDDRHEVDGIVVHFVVISSILTLFEPNLEARVDGKKELGVKLLVENLPCPKN